MFLKLSNIPASKFQKKDIPRRNAEFCNAEFEMRCVVHILLIANTYMPLIQS